MFSCRRRLPSTVLSHTHSTCNREASAIHLPETLRPASIEQNHFLLLLPCPPFHLKGLWSRCIILNRPAKGEGWVGGGHAYRCCASSEYTKHDDNHNDDDDKDDDSEECRLTEHLTPNSPLKSNTRLPQNESSLCAIIRES